MSMMNGHVRELDTDRLMPSPLPPRSESDLSDLNDVPTARPYQQEEAHSEDDAIHDMATSEMDEDEDAPGEEDADYDAETPPPGPSDGMRHDRSLSEESTRPGKRKPDVDDEEYMKENPELYGLRRSVSVSSRSFHSQSLTCCRQGRARPSRRVVCAPALSTHIGLALTFILG